MADLNPVSSPILSPETTATNASSIATLEQDPEASRGRSQYLRPDEQLRNWSIALTNAAADTGLLEELSHFGYDAQRIGEGIALHGKVTELFAQQKKEFGEQLAASAELSVAFEKAHIAYMKSVKIARMAFEDDANATVALQLRGERSRVIAKWSKQAETFYANLLDDPDFLNKMAYFGYTAEKLTDEQGLVRAVKSADAKHKQERGESQEATALRDHALAELESWMSKFYRVCRIAFDGKEQWLEKLGLKE